MPVDALLHDSAAIHSLRVALRRHPSLPVKCPLCLLSSWDELHSRANEKAFDVVLVQPSFPVRTKVPPNGLRNIERLTQVLEPGRVILFLSKSDQTGALLQALAPPRFPFVLLQGIDDHPSSILRVLSRAQSHRMIRHPLGPFRADREPGSIELVLAVLTGWPPPNSVEHLAQRLGLSPRTLRRKMAEQCLPPPGRLLRWGRLFEAVYLRKLGIRSRARIASILELGGVSALAHLAKDLTGDRLGQILRPDGEEDLLAAFFEDLAG